MKKIILFAATFFLFNLCVQSQTVNDIPIKDLDVEYVQIVGTSKFLSSKINIELDFGWQNKFWTNKEYQVKDAEGKKIDFNSMIDASNFMTKNGF